MSFYPRLKGLCTAKVNLQGSFLFVHIKDCTVRYWIQILPLRNQNAKAIQRSHWWNHSGFWPICRLLSLEGKLQQAEFICTGLLLVTLSIFTSAVELFHVLPRQMRGSRAAPRCSIHSPQLQDGACTESWLWAWTKPSTATFQCRWTGHKHSTTLRDFLKSFRPFNSS